MRRFAVCAVLIAVLFPALAAAQGTKFSHIVIVVQENRTPDNLFHALRRLLPGADIAASGVNSKGETIRLKPVPLSVPFDLGHTHDSFVTMYDGGRMDGADLVRCAGPCPKNAAFHFVRYPDVAPYIAMAVHYGFANRMFQSNQGPSFPAHQFLFAGTSQPNPHSPLFAADNMDQPREAAGCVAPPNQRVPMIGPGGVEDVHLYPCFEHATLTDLLDRPRRHPNRPISWRYYSIGAESIWTAPSAIAHTCEPAANPPRCTSPQWTGGDIVGWPAQILVDIAHRRLRSVSWVIPTGQDSDHAGGNNGTGPSWVASIVNAIGQSKYWNRTAILVLWDDWGGWYDHVAPPIERPYGYYQLGFRVPLLVISPYTPAGYISNKQHDFGSILRFVETVFDLGRIPPGTFADARADDLMDFFDFSKPARTFVPIRTAVPESFFLNPKRPMTWPDVD